MVISFINPAAGHSAHQHSSKYSKTHSGANGVWGGIWSVRQMEVKMAALDEEDPTLTPAARYCSLLAAAHYYTLALGVGHLTVQELDMPSHTDTYQDRQRKDATSSALSPPPSPACDQLSSHRRWPRWRPPQSRQAIMIDGGQSLQANDLPRTLLYQHGKKKNTK